MNIRGKLLCVFGTIRNCRACVRASTSMSKCDKEGD